MLSIPIAAALLFASCAKKQAGNAAAMMAMMQVPVRAVPAVSSNVPLTTSADGNVEAISSVDVKSRVAGQILLVYFGEGQEVRPRARAGDNQGGQERGPRACLQLRRMIAQAS